MSDVGVLDKVMAILHLLERGEGRLEPPEVASRIDVSVPTAYRLMKALAEHGLLERHGTRYGLGMALMRLGARAADGMDLRTAARPHLEWLRDETGENAELHVRRDASRVPVEVVLSAKSLRPIGEVGVALPLHVGASARVLLAWLDTTDALRLAHISSQAAGPEDQLDEAQFTRLLAHAKTHGWVGSAGERKADVASVAAPVFDRFGSVAAAVALSGPSSRLNKRAQRAAAPAVREAAARISHSIGHDLGSRVETTA